MEVLCACDPVSTCSSFLPNERLINQLLLWPPPEPPLATRTLSCADHLSSARLWPHSPAVPGFCSLPESALCSLSSSPWSRGAGRAGRGSHSCPGKSLLKSRLPFSVLGFPTVLSLPISHIQKPWRWPAGACHRLLLKVSRPPTEA